MKFRTTILAGIAIGVLAAGIPQADGSSTPACPAPMSCTYKPQMTIDMVPGNDGHSVAAWADGYGGPIAWINGITAGFYFLGDGTGHRGVRGEHICITYKLQFGHEAACLLSDGTLELRPTGPGGSLGPPQFLTAGGISFINSMRAAGITVPELLRALCKLGIMPAPAGGITRSARSDAAAATPVTYLYTNNGWRDPVVRPGRINFGGGHAPYLIGLTWTAWQNGQGAFAHGTLKYETGGVWLSFRMHLVLQTVKLHGTTHYWYNMGVWVYHNGKWEGPDSGAFHTLCGTCTVPVWVFPAVWPFL